MKKYTNKKKKIIIGMSLGVVVAASAISVAVVTTSHHNSTPSINENEISVNFKTENNKVHLNKLVSEPVGYANSNLQLEVHDANGNVVKDATFTATNLPEGINFSKTGILNGVAKKDGIFYANIVANSPSLNASKTLNVEIDVPKPLEVKVHNASFVDVIGSQGDTFTIATNDPSDKYQIISGVLPSGIIFNNDTGVFSGTPATSGTFHLTVHVTNPNSEYSYSNIQVNLQVETAIEALIAGAENISQALKNNVNKFNDLLASLGNTWNVGKDIYSKSTDIVNDVSAIVGKTQNAYNEIVNLFNEASKVFAGD
jgi:gas vesicle protein